MPYNPYQLIFPRGKVLQPFLSRSLVHPLERARFEQYFRKKNTKGWWHDLGAQDVFLDNLGMLFQEQFDQNTFRHYTKAIHFLMLRWHLLSKHVAQREPYWGLWFNARTRNANSGEPRSLLRLLSDDDWASLRLADDLSGGLDRAYDDLQSYRRPDQRPNLLNFYEYEEPVRRFLTIYAQDDSTFFDWNGSDLFTAVDSLPADWTRPKQYSVGGVLLPADGPPYSERLRVLHPRHSTPDLPLRVGTEPLDFELYTRLLRDQGDLGTCVAFATSVALDVLAHRLPRTDTGLQFSPAWIHCSTTGAGTEGRHVKQAIDSIRNQLPCEDYLFPYYSHKQLIKEMQAGDIAWRTDERENGSDELQRRFRLYTRKVDVDDIATLKALLAAGWVVVASTRLTEAMIGRGFMDYGRAATPLPLQRYLDTGHAWCLVGYDHVDGNNQWKYQGSFVAMNSWGNQFPTHPIAVPGLCYLPFAVMLNAGIEAHALRLEQR